MLINEFETISPKNRYLQKDIIDWIINIKSKLFQKSSFEETIRKIESGISHIESRYSVLEDCLTKDFSQMNHFNINEDPKGVDINKRMKTYADEAEKVFIDSSHD